MSTVTSIRWQLVAWLAVPLLMLIFAALVAAQTPQEIAQRYGITFPIPELGNCSSISECHTYCEDPLNQQKCIDYAKSKGFHQEGPDPDKILAAARRELGCDTAASCQSFCEIPANFNKCHSFAQSQSLTGGYIHDPAERELLDQARQTLGCDSPSSCISFCNDPANRDKCFSFAQQVGLRGGEHRVGPGGCTSEVTCRAFCSDPNNFQICSGFAGSSGGTFSGPGGCNSPESCRAYCEKNPADCGYVGGVQPGASPPPGYNPQEMCNKTPNCSWTGSTCQCGIYGETQESQQRAREYADFCKNNPDKCKVGPGGYPIPEDKANQIGTPPGGYENYQDYCKRYPIECQIYQQGAPTGGTYTPSPSYTPPPVGGYPTPGTYTPPPESGSYTQPSYTPAPTESSPPPPVYGVTATRGLLQLILDYLSNLF